MTAASVIGARGIHSGPAPVLSATGIVKHFGAKRVLDGVGISVGPGEVVGLVGENGCGKTTLLRICAGLLRHDSGSVTLSGRLGYCPQQPGLLDLLTVDEHLRYFGAALGMRREAAVAAGRQLLAELDFPLSDRTLARHLSGGNGQKLNLALALLGDPDVLLLDEPYQGFDRGVYVDFWEHVAAWRRQGKATVIVTHMLAELSQVDRVVELTVRSRAAPGVDGNPR